MGLDEMDPENPHSSQHSSKRRLHRARRWPDHARDVNESAQEALFRISEHSMHFDEFAKEFHKLADLTIQCINGGDTAQAIDAQNIIKNLAMKQTGTPATIRELAKDAIQRLELALVGEFRK